MWLYRLGPKCLQITNFFLRGPVYETAHYAISLLEFFLLNLFSCWIFSSEMNKQNGTLT